MQILRWCCKCNLAMGVCFVFFMMAVIHTSQLKIATQHLVGLNVGRNGWLCRRLGDFRVQIGRAKATCSLTLERQHNIQCGALNEPCLGEAQPRWKSRGL